MEPQYQDWQQVLDLIQRTDGADQQAALMTMLLTPDEREAVTARVNILCELLKGELSQRQISQMLGVGVATITRGSAEVKRLSDENKLSLSDLLLK
ncbi:Trp operon repressor [Vibrio sp. 10N.286.49.C2]|uniref:trp operon repressor n=1 Tax=unclassified Vibrio TaxID=2614977 RepID=UPI000C85A35F|nr:MULTISPECIES: trp operon repressor [unclassified Vibrio]PMH27650.1 Trp operon repressor [Vibrio sp. 10N.286.49.C2]PMH53076.1 Trp operon repressor [Vibrio sp. 10N.286.49.B1]PMH80169.1 Trp operon repressor [Vibrio sp. 10N.286.48.B7]